MEARLSTLHQALHQALLDGMERASVAAVALDFQSASQCFGAVAQTVMAHRIDEEAALVELAEHEPPRGAGRALIVAEHDKLDQLLAAAVATLDALADLAALPLDAQRLALVRHLDTLLRAKHVLEHHTSRENEILYPHLVIHLPIAARQVLEDRIAALLDTYRADAT